MLNFNKMRLISILLISTLFWSCDDSKDLYTIPDVEVVEGEFVDARDQQVYKTIKIGQQEWLAENLRYRLPKGPLDGCYTFGEVNITASSVQPTRAQFTDSINRAIANKEIVEIEGLTEMQQPTFLIPYYLSFGVGVATVIAQFSHYPDVAKVFDRIMTNFSTTKTIELAVNNLTIYENRNQNYSKEYGFLYTYNGALKAVPEGWRLPTDEDWKILEKNVGISEAELEKLDDWRGQVANKFLANTSESIGFDAKLGGGRVYGQFLYGTPYANRQINGYYWSSTLHQANDSTTYPITRNFALYNKGVWRGTAKREAAYHIKCIKK